VATVAPVHANDAVLPIFQEQARSFDRPEQRSHLIIFVLAVVAVAVAVMLGVGWTLLRFFL
jgi:hypothetical protein